MPNIFRAPDRIVTGWGSLSELGRLTAPLGRRALLVTGRSAMKKAGITDRAVMVLREAGLAAEVWDHAEPEPDVLNADAAREAARRFAADVVLGLGGGSAMDVAKVASGLAGETAPTVEFLGGRKIAGPCLPFVAIPATSGTGSEATVNSVLSDRAQHVKTSIRDDRLMARVALVDPELTVACPADITAHSGLDALSQAIESYISMHATPITEALSLRAAEELAASLETAVRRPADREARTRAALGSLMAGLALGNARLGVIHGLVHPLGVRYGIPHGLACGVLLPTALEYNREAMGPKYAALARALGGDPVEFVRRLLDRVGVKESLRPFGVQAALFGTLADESLPSGSLKANPRTVTRDDLIAMLRRLC
jgi:alcohol dehydrogenase